MQGIAAITDVKTNTSRPVHRLLLAFLILASLGAALFWLAWIIRAPSAAPLFQEMGLALTSAFVLSHPLALAAGMILWRARVFDGLGRIALMTVTVYFLVANLYAIGGVFLMASLVNGL